MTFAETFSIEKCPIQRWHQLLRDSVETYDLIWHTTTYIKSLFYSLPNNFKNHLYDAVKNLNPVFPTIFCMWPCNPRNITFPKTASICKGSNGKDKCNCTHPQHLFFSYMKYELCKCYSGHCPITDE